MKHSILPKTILNPKIGRVKLDSALPGMGHIYDENA
jgi:hypothetical protein